MTIADALHYSPEERQRIIDSYPAHEREARTLGIPTLGTGLIFPVLEENIVLEPSDPEALAADRRHRFWLGSPICGCRLAWDRDNESSTSRPTTGSANKLRCSMLLPSRRGALAPLGMAA